MDTLARDDGQVSAPYATRCFDCRTQFTQQSVPQIDRAGGKCRPSEIGNRDKQAHGHLPPREFLSDPRLQSHGFGPQAIVFQGVKSLVGEKLDLIHCVIARMVAEHAEVRGKTA